VSSACSSGATAAGEVQRIFEYCLEGKDATSPIKYPTIVLVKEVWFFWSFS
jgi:hypothetical protein